MSRPKLSHGASPSESSSEAHSVGWISPVKAVDFTALSETRAHCSGPSQDADSPAEPQSRLRSAVGVQGGSGNDSELQASPRCVHGPWDVGARIRSRLPTRTGVFRKPMSCHVVWQRHKSLVLCSCSFGAPLRQHASGHPLINPSFSSSSPVSIPPSISIILPSPPF